MGKSASKDTFGSGSTAEDVTRGINLKDKNVLITGANTGIGKESARVLAKRGANVFMLCRNESKGKQALQDIINELNNDNEYKEFSEKENIADIDSRLKLVICDLGSLKSIFDFCKKFIELNVALDGVLLNAGIYMPPKYETTTDNFEIQFGVNHLGHFYLVKLLMPMLLKNDITRIVVVASAAHSWAPNYLSQLMHSWYQNNTSQNKKNYDPKSYYGVSKCCNILFARALDYKYSQNGIECVSLHPGIIRSDLFRHQKFQNLLINYILRPLTKSVPQGAATQLRCLTLNSDDIKCGGYYDDCNFADNKLTKQMESNDISNDFEFNHSMEGKLWKLSENLIKKRGYPLNLSGKIKSVSYDVTFDDEKTDEQNKTNSSLLITGVVISALIATGIYYFKRK